MSDTAEKSKASKRRRVPKRSERRFIAQSPYSPWLLHLFGGLGAATLGAGGFAYFYGESFRRTSEAAAAASDAGGPFRIEAIPSYIVAAGGVLTGLAVWLGTSSEVPLRVGDAGIAMDRGEVRRMPWWAVERIAWDSPGLALVVTGSDEAGEAWTLRVSVKSHPDAVGWLVREARTRVPNVVDIEQDILDRLPAGHPHAGTTIDLEPLQVVGKRDTLSRETISYEPDAHVCIRCERVYLRKTMPQKCTCGASLTDNGKSRGARGVADEVDDRADDAAVPDPRPIAENSP